MSEPPLFSIADEASHRRARLPARRAPSSDRTRVRDMLVAAIAGAFALALAWLFLPGPALASRLAVERAPGPLGRPHAQAGLTCASCHDVAGAQESGAAGSCVSCHAAHPSTRAGHRALVATGELGCTTCHRAHGAAQGVTFKDGAMIRWGGSTEQVERASSALPSGTTVALVGLGVCVGCHNAENPRDPIARCATKAAASPSVSLCFDEHQRGDDSIAATSLSTSPARSACAAQHGGARYVAWEAAREVALRIPWVAPAKAPSRAPWTWLGLGALGAALGYVGSAVARRARAKRERVVAESSATSALAPPSRVRLPQINTNTCLGCYACVDACPFDVLEVQRFVAVVVRSTECCGVGVCQQVCPNDSLRITEGEPIEERPRVDAHLESEDAPGVFLAGDLTGLPLIKNAIAQGARVISRIAQKRDAAAPKADLDVVIVGAGPAGLSAALRAQELGLTYVVLEQGTVASSLRSFPRNKLVFDQPLDMPVVGALWMQECTKEELLAQWTRIVRTRRLEILEGHRVTAIARTEAAFTITAAKSDGARELHAANLVLAIGRRGTPRTLDAVVAAGAEANVSYALADARSFADKRVLIVGLGDSAMEAAAAIAMQPGARVTLAYRGNDFARGKARNIAEVKALAASGKVRLALSSVVERVDRGSVTLRTPAGHESLGNDAVIVLIGGVPSWDLVRAAGVKLGV